MDQLPYELLSDIVVILLKFEKYTGLQQSESARAFCQTCRCHRAVSHPILVCFRKTNPCATINWRRLYPSFTHFRAFTMNSHNASWTTCIHGAAWWSDV